MTTPLIGLSGYARTGKDTVAAHLAKHGYQRLGFADSLRDVALALDPTIHAPTHGRQVTLSTLIEVYGWEYAKDAYPDVRRLLQRLGTDVGRRFFGENIWVDLAMVKVVGPTVFTDVRFPNEADAIRERGGQVWRIVRPGWGPVNGHPSETAMDIYPYHQTITNSAGLDELHARVDEALALLPIPAASGPWELPIGLRWSEDPDLPVHQVHQVPEVHLCRQPEACHDAHNGIRA